jgi:hypothetical protein
MAVSTASVTVATTATQLSGADSGGSTSGQSVAVYVPTGGATVYVGSSAVTTAIGFPVAAGEKMAFSLEPGESLYGIVAASTQAVNVFRSGV